MRRRFLDIEEGYADINSDYPPVEAGRKPPVSLSIYFIVILISVMRSFITSIGRK